MGIGGMLFIVLVACFWLGMAAYLAHKELRYRNLGVRTTAQVIQKERHYSGGRHGSGWHNVLKYHYQDSAKATFEGQGDVSLSLWEKSEEGHDLTIEYLRDEPSESRPLDSSSWHWFGAGCSGVMGLSVFIGYLCMVIEEFRDRQRV
jgi:hypothetical protein